MMLPTHLLAGLALALPVASVAPELAPAAFAGAGAGSVVPDLDVVARHRRSLHYPVYAAVAALPAVVLAVLLPIPATAGLALFLVGAALHCRLDAVGGSMELRPWTKRSDRGVFDHRADEWRAPRRWIEYDGSPGDLAASGMLAVPLLLFANTSLRWVVVGALLVAIGYTGLRRWLPDLIERAAAAAPPKIEDVLSIEESDADG